jgi:hypothetical protein
MILTSVGGAKGITLLGFVVVAMLGVSFFGRNDVLVEQGHTCVVKWGEDVFFWHGLGPGRCQNLEEGPFGHSSTSLHLVVILSHFPYTFESREDHHIKSLQEVGGVRWVAKNKNAVLPCIFETLDFEMRAMAVQDKGTIAPTNLLLCEAIKDLEVLCEQVTVHKALLCVSYSEHTVILQLLIIGKHSQCFERIVTPPFYLKIFAFEDH